MDPIALIEHMLPISSSQKAGRRIISRNDQGKIFVSSAAMASPSGFCPMSLGLSLSTKIASGHQILTCDEGGTLLGIAYFAPKEFTDRVWELMMIAVDAPRHRQGIGSRMLQAVEDAVRDVNGRLLLIETSDKSSFERTWLFYRKHGYTEVAHIPDYFADGDGKASFIKRIRLTR